MFLEGTHGHIWRDLGLSQLVGKRMPLDLTSGGQGCHPTAQQVVPAAKNNPVPKVNDDTIEKFYSRGLVFSNLSLLMILYILENKAQGGHP